MFRLKCLIFLAEKGCRFSLRSDFQAFQIVIGVIICTHCKVQRGSLVHNCLGFDVIGLKGRELGV
jgi:hypothetical protein